VKPPPEGFEAQEGWGAAPSEDPAEQVTPWKPERNYDQTLAAIKERKDAEKPEPPKRPLAKPEHSPDHWVEEFRSKGYPEEAARALSVGKAAEERGLDLPMAEVRAIVKRLEDSGVYLYSTAPISSDARNLREYLVGRTETFDVHRARSLAAVAAHADAVERRAIPLKMPGRPRGDGDIFDDRRGWFDRTVAFYSALANRGLNHPDKDSGYTIRWGVARGYHKPPGRKHGRIALSDSDTVFAHEWAHALEALNPHLLDRSRGFLETRTKGEPLKRLGGRYGAREKARADGFYEAYVGKDYSRAGKAIATEILSMGLEKIATGQGWWLLRSDPEHFYFCLGQLFG
jgi:hypothetical protein